MRTLAIIIGLLGLGALAPSAMATPHDAPATVSVGRSAYGPVLFDRRGFALYAFTRDGTRRSTCSGTCAREWPPYLARGVARAGPGARVALLGSVRRADGSRQVTYAGRPLYAYVGDRRRGQILCQNVYEFGGRWLVVRATGRLVQ